MAPIRRYLRITKHSVLEVRIYLDRPADAEAWLLRRHNPALPRIIQAVRPLVLPKLREENERSKGRGASKARKKGVKDVIVEDDFEVSIFLTELSTRHTVLTKQKAIKEKPRIQSNPSKLTNWLATGTRNEPVIIPEGSEAMVRIREENEDEPIVLDDIPDAPEGGASVVSDQETEAREYRRDVSDTDIIDSDDSGQSKQSSNERRSRPSRVRQDTDPSGEAEALEDHDDKKKLRLNTSYDGFSIYGRILCLVVKRKGPRATGAATGLPISSQHMLENWVSTQQAAADPDDDDDEETG